jgi:DNA-binding SARP family transcriptional activator
LRLQIDLLGQFRVTVDDRVIPADAWRRARGAALVKLLALSAGHRLHREQVMAAFWPDLDPDAAGANLRKAVHFARRSLGDAQLIDSSDIVVLAPNDERVIDTETFEAAAKAALREQEPGACERAADLYGGELLPDDRYAEWIEEPRKQLQTRYARVLKAGKLWERLLALDPTDEEAASALMQAALDAGNRGEVVRQFQRLRERLRIDFGLGPKAATIALYERALAAPAFAPVSLVERLRASLAWGLVHLHSGDFTKAERIARETRDLAFGAELAREVGEASALLGLTAQMQGRWLDLFRSEFVEWVRAAPAFVAHVFDGHFCLAQFCHCGAAGHQQLGAVARELLAAADHVGSSAGRGLAMLCLGEAALFSGRLDEAERLLTEAERPLVETGTAAGQAIILERLAEIALARGQKWRAGRLLQRAVSVAETSWLSPHLLIRLKRLAVETASTPDQTAEAILERDRTLARSNTCQPCSMGFRAAAAIALAEAGELEQLAQVGARLDEAEHLAGMWSGGPWVATLWEARGVQRRAQGSEDRALAAFSEAAARFADLGRPLDEARCQARRRGASLEPVTSS